MSRAIRGLWLIFGLLAGPVFAAQAAPPLPPEIAGLGVLRIGVKCDYPPQGYLDANRNFAGVEVDMGRALAAEAFGAPDKAAFECVTAENRIPALIGKKIDLVIATLGVTPERARVIGFSEPYRWGGGDVLVPKNSAIQTLADLEGHKVVVLKGTTEEQYLVDKMPGVELLKLNNVSDAMQALRQGRVDAYAHDDAILEQLASKNPDMRVIHAPYAINDTAVGMRRNEPALKAWVDAALAKFKADGLYAKLIDKWVEPDQRAMMTAQFQQPRPSE